VILSEIQKKLLSVLIVADSRETLLERATWERWGMHCLEGCRSGEVVAAIEKHLPDFVIIDQATAGGMSVLETLAASWPKLPVVLISDTENWADVRAAFIRGAFDCLIKPLTTEVMAGLVNRLRIRVENLSEGGVFSSRRSEAARAVLFGNPLSSDTDSLPCWPQFWQVVSVEVVPHSLSFQTVYALIEDCMSDSSALGLREHGHERPTLLLTVFFHDRSAAGVEQMAALQTQNLVQLLRDSGSWAAAGLGSVGTSAEVATSLQRARLAVGYSLARGPGIYKFQGEQEVASLVCTDLAHYTHEVPSRIQGGGDWEGLVELFFEALPFCASVRRLQQEVQGLFSRIADLAANSSSVERYYHIVDFVHGPEELRAELKTLCTIAFAAVRISGRSLADRKLQEFQDFVTRHYAEQLDLATVSTALQISPSYLSKILHRSLKTTFVKFITDIRMAKSRELLSGTDLLTSQIAERVGFVYTHYFSSLFKKRYATTPSEFRSWCRAQTMESAVI